MCGIAGVLERDGSKPARDRLHAMARAIAHRGPDAEGIESFEGCGLAHRRLAVVDLSEGGAQPKSSPDGRVWVVFNGEIYNYKELRHQLEGFGHKFQTASDTEVLLTAYLQWGESFVARLDGQFAFAIWDGRTRELLLARDRTGKKPLAVYEDAQRLVFASEIKGLWAHGDLNRQLSHEAVPQFLSHGFVPTPATSYAHVRRLRPATYEVHSVRTREYRVVEYWDFPLHPARVIESPHDLTMAENEVREATIAAVKRRLIADVPIGAFLSGGVDSSIVVGVMAQLLGTPVKTFSIGFENEPAWDETKFARQVAERFKTQHTEFIVAPKSFELIDTLAKQFDEPFADSSCVPTFLVSQLTREHVTVALTGDGGDELFAGYPRFFAATAAERVPSPLRSIVRRLARRLPHQENHGSSYERMRRRVSTAAEPLYRRMHRWQSVFTPDEIHDLLTDDYLRYATEPLLSERYVEADTRAREHGAETLNRALYINARTYLLDDLNTKMDRTSMAVGLEARAPFLDRALCELAFSLPGSVKLRGSTTKWLLKRAFRDLLPEAIVSRPKMGFGIPFGSWFRGALKVEVTERLLETSSSLHTYVKREAIERVMASHHAQHRDWGLQLWALLQLEAWLRHEQEHH